MEKVFKVDLTTSKVEASDDDYCIGVVGENNVTTLKFEYSDTVDCEDAQIIFNTATGSHIYKALYDFTIPVEVLTDILFSFQLVHNYENRKWKSEKVYVSLLPSADDSGENTLNEMKKRWTAEAQRPLTILVNILKDYFNKE